MGKVIFALVFAVAVLVGGYYFTSWDRVDPGNIGILVDYGNGSIQPVTETKWIWVGRYQKLVEWPAGQQSYVMERGDSTGQIKGDDSIMCRSSDSQNIAFDAQVDWRLDPKQIVQVYQLRKDVPLVGARNRESPGNYLEDLVIRTALRDAVTKTCPEYTWSNLLGVEQLKFQEEVEQKVIAAAAPQGVIISGVTILRPYPNTQIETLLQARLEGQRQQETSAFSASQAKRQQEIDQQAAIAATEKARIEAEGRAKVDIANATAAAEVARVKAAQEAEAIRSRGAAEAASLDAQAKAVTPALVELERARKWNGQGPTTILGTDPHIINQVPLR